MSTAKINTVFDSSCRTINVSSSQSSIGLLPPCLHDTPKVPVDISELKSKAIESDNEARKCGVEVARRTFFARLIALASSTLLLVSSALLTGVTGGVGAPALALASVGFVIAVGDVVCAGYDLLNKGKGGDGLPKGFDSIANAIYWISGKCGVDEDKSSKIASYVSTLVRGALTFSNILIAFLLPVAAPAIIQNLSPAVSISNAILVTAVNSFNTSAGLSIDDEVKCKEKNAKLQSNLESSEKFNDEINKLTDIYRENISIAEGVIHDLKCKNEVLESNIDSSDEEIKTLQSQVSDRHNDITVLNDALKVKEHVFNFLQEELINKNDEVSLLTYKLDAEKQALQVLQNALMQRDEELQSLKIAMDRAREDMHLKLCLLLQEFDDFKKQGFYGWSV